MVGDLNKTLHTELVAGSSVFSVKIMILWDVILCFLVNRYCKESRLCLFYV